MINIIVRVSDMMPIVRRHRPANISRRYVFSNWENCPLERYSDLCPLRTLILLFYIVVPFILPSWYFDNTRRVTVLTNRYCAYNNCDIVIPLKPGFDDRYKCNIDALEKNVIKPRVQSTVCALARNHRIFSLNCELKRAVSESGRRAGLEIAFRAYIYDTIK